MTEVDDFLNTPMGSVPNPPKLPPGSWAGKIIGYKVGSRKINDEEINVVTLMIRPVQPDKDVDRDLLAGLDYTRMMVSTDYRLDPEGRKRLDRFLAKMFGENKTAAGIGAYLPLLSGKDVYFKITHTEGTKENDDGEKPIFVNIKELKPLE